MAQSHKIYLTLAPESGDFRICVIETIIPSRPDFTEYATPRDASVRVDVQANMRPGTLMMDPENILRPGLQGRLRKYLGPIHGVPVRYVTI